MIKLYLFVSYHGKGYLCNPKYLHKYMANEYVEYNDYKFIWAVKKNGQFKYYQMQKLLRYNGI